MNKKDKIEDLLRQIEEKKVLRNQYIKKEKEETPQLNIYQKLQKIQSEVKELIRSEENKFQKYKFFNELQVLQLLKPLLTKYRLTILFSDEESKEFSCE